MKKILIALTLLFSTSLTQACINTYAFNMEVAGISKENALENLKTMSKKNKTYQELNDYAVMLIYAHRYRDAIQLLKSIEKTHPNLPKTAANLGTAYELQGDIKKAKYWIEQGIKRDPNIHEGSEWIHVKILDAQTNQHQDKNWINNNDVLGLDFGIHPMPYAAVKEIKFKNKVYDLDTVLGHSSIQMTQRLAFVEKDPISAQIVMNMANIEMLNYTTDQRTVGTLFDIAQRLGYSNQQLLNIRKGHYFHSKWYAFKMQMNHFFIKFADLFRFLVSTN